MTNNLIITRLKITS